MKKIIFSQYGRSMVEMLGVLAIIGVLSVGSISGYSKAMLKYKLNKQAEQISTLINAGLRYAGTWYLGESTNTTNYFIKLGEVPSEMIKKNKNSFIYDIFNTQIYYMYTINAQNEKYTQFFIELDTSKSEDYSLSICRNIAITVKEFSNNITRLSIINAIDMDSNLWTKQSLWGDNYCTAKVACLKDVTISQIDDFCRFNTNQNKAPHLKVVWYE